MNQNYPGNNIQGWMQLEELRWLFAQASQMQNVVELGSWRGRSTHALLSAGAQVTTVDNWSESIKGHDPGKAYKDFCQLQDFPNLTVMKMNSTIAAKSFGHKSVDMVFIDADHSYSAVMADIITWFPITRKLICGHDFVGQWPGVQRAVKKLFGPHFKVYKDIWYVVRMA